jgi:site-specific DNA-methyltransferase (adenine-specific)
MPESYYSDASVQLYLGDSRDILPGLGQFDAAVVDPPYAETALEWDRWVDGWPTLVAAHTSSMWCFGSMRMFLDRRDEFAGWRLSQDVVWEKHNGTGSAVDRFRRVHEHAVFWYRGSWSDRHHQVPRVPAEHDLDKSVTRSFAGAHHGEIGAHRYADDGLRLMRSVIKRGSVRGGLHPTEKPAAILAPLVEYAVPPGGLVLDPFAGSGSTLLTARQTRPPRDRHRGERSVLRSRGEAPGRLGPVLGRCRVNRPVDSSQFQSPPRTIPHHFAPLAGRMISPGHSGRIPLTRERPGQRWCAPGPGPHFEQKGGRC